LANHTQNRIRILIADDDSQVLNCYRRAFSRLRRGSASFEALSAELFGSEAGTQGGPMFESVLCTQGFEAVTAASEAMQNDQPFDVVILDIRMPPGISGAEVGERIRHIDQDVPIVFVSGYSDVSEEELKSRVAPQSRLYFYRKPLSFGELAQDIAGIVQEARTGAG
jgi:CheY-like chemotaxis protein